MNVYNELLSLQKQSKESEIIYKNKKEELD